MKEKIRSFVEGSMFSILIFTLIALNTISLGIETFNLPDALNQLLSLFNTVCIVIFVIEIILKLYVYGFNFFKDAWNIFDVFIVIISVLPMIKFLSSMRAFRVFRMLRALRALRMMKRLEKLRIIVQALLRALPSVGWVVLLLVLIYYVFAVIGTNLFADLSPEYFGTLWKSLYSLFQITMADDLGNISRPLLVTGISAVVYFVSFVALSTILVLNVIVGVVVDSVAEIKNGSQNSKNTESDKKVNLLPVNTKSDTADNSDLLKEIALLEQQLEKVKGLISSNNQDNSN